MKVVGHRVERQISKQESGVLLAEGARFNETIAHLSRVAYIPKGVYRFKSHEEANRHEEECLVRAMARRVQESKHG
jgi:phage FluMu gp28-like protein